MTPSPQRRSAAISIVEILVVMAIIAVLVGLLLPALQQVRRAAERSKAQNQLRQISIATHNYLTTNDGRFPHFASPENHTYTTPIIKIMFHLAPFQVYLQTPTSTGTYQGLPFQNSADPSYVELANVGGDCSYVANALLYRFGATLDNTALDGSSQTINWTEQYANCEATAYRTFVGTADPPEFIRGRPYYNVSRRASFADRPSGDVYPLTTNGVTRPARDGWPVDVQTFQVRPDPRTCLPRVPTAVFPQGLNVAMADGSMRSIAPTISTETFWALVTPAGGEVCGSDW